MKIKRVTPVFVDSIPAEIEDGVLYVSIRFRTAIHRCCCGCGMEVTTPIRPLDWQLTYDGESVSLNPSIGNWSFPCRSHYWIRCGRVIDAPQWSEQRIAANRIDDLRRKGIFTDDVSKAQEKKEASISWWKRLVRWLLR